MVYSSFRKGNTWNLTIQSRTEAIIISSISKLQTRLDEHIDGSSSLLDDIVSGRNSVILTTQDQFRHAPTHLESSYTSNGRSFFRALGIHGCFVSYSCQNGRRYHLILRFPLLRNTAIVLELGLKTFPYTGSGIEIFRQHLSLRNVVAETSPIMMASRQGDLQTVKALLENRRASPFDITEDGETPLEVCARDFPPYTLR
jgi:hypothetical protein